MSKITPITTHHCATCGMALEVVKAEWIDDNLQLLLAPCQNCAAQLRVNSERANTCACGNAISPNDQCEGCAGLV